MRLTLATLLVTLLVGLGWWMGDGPVLLASPAGELWGHAWVQWWHGEALPAWPAGTSLAEGATPWPVIDPATTALAGLLGRMLGYGVAWNLVVLGGVALAFQGAARLARGEGGAPLVAGMVLATSPIFTGSLASGLSEDAALGLLPLAWLALREGDRRAGDRRAWAWSIGGGVLVGASAWFGLYIGYLGGLVALGLGLSAVLGDRSRLPRWVVAGGLALLIGLGAGLLQGERLGGTGHHAGQHIAAFEPFWRLNPWKGADLLSFFSPGRVTVPEDVLMRGHPAYLGFVALGLALFAGRSGWWVLLLGAMALSTGLELRAAGEPLGVNNPLVALFHQLPYAELLNHHGRILLVGQVALAVLAGKGALRAARWVPTPVWAGLVLVEMLTLSPTALPLPTASARIAPIWQAAAQADGSVLPVPAGGPGVHFQRPLYAQRAHGRPLAIRPNQAGYGRAGNTELGRWLGAVGFPQRPSAPERGLEGLGEVGVGVIVVEEGYVEIVEGALGPPDHRAEGGALWWVRPPKAP